MLEVFEDDIRLLELLYLEIINTHFDYEGKLFIKLVERNKSFLKESTSLVLKSKGVEPIQKFDEIWKSDDYENLIDTILDEILDNRESYFLLNHHDLLEDIFIVERNKFINDRKRDYLYKYIDLNYNDLEKTKKIFYVINKMFNPEARAEFLVYILKKDDNINFFKSIPLIPGGIISWVGSERDLIKNEIRFLKKVKQKLKGIDYIEHRYYLEEKARNTKKYLDKVYREDYIWENP